MKKVYLKPTTENVALGQEGQLMMHSQDHADSKSYGGWSTGGHTVITNGQYDNGNNQNNSNLWDD